MRDSRLRDERSGERTDEQQPAACNRGLRTGATGDQPRREQQRPEPARNGNAGDEPESPDFAFARLAQELEPQSAVGACTFRFNLFALELEAPCISIERFLQRRDDDAGQTSFEMAERTAAWRELLRFGFCWGTASATACNVRDADEHVENPKPGNTHLLIMSRAADRSRLRSQPCVAKILLLCSEDAARRFNGHDFLMRIRGQGHGCGLRGTGAVGVHDLHSVARLVPLDHGGERVR